MTGFEDVVKAWDADARTGGHTIHPLPTDSAEWWVLGEIQAHQVKRHAPLGSTVIDFGAGLGRLSIPLAHMGFHVIAVDASKAMLDGLTERATAAGTTIDTIHSDGTDLGDHINDCYADVVVSRAVLIHHDYAGVEQLVNALAATLRPGGRLIADWPTGTPHERRSWTDVTVWDAHHRLAVATLAGLEPLDLADDPPVWAKKGIGQ